jgi:histidyl-tRNA synthetase
MMAVGERSLKSQMRQADGLGVAYAVIIGERELKAGTAVLKDLRDGSQRELPAQDAVDFLARRASESAT